MTFTVETSSGIPFIGFIESLLTVTVIAFLLHLRRKKFMNDETH